MKDVYALGVDEDSLLLQKEELEYHFQFDIDHYVILAQIMLKLDLNLKKTRHEVVPEIITEDEFWRNYFYKVECLKKQLGVSNRLGAPIAREQREQQLLQRQEELQD
mmetsp:Transcript_34584/g.45473  ORF Transcript_34584/g.45473 Transcript_34584/m.45473 type:complete len:107 (-) Transcript_34584:229-549(-)